MTAAAPSKRPPESPLPLVSFWCGLSAFIIAFVALPLWASGYGAIFAIALDIAALPACFIALVAGLPGLKKDNSGYALAGLALAALGPLLTYLVFNSWAVANLFRF